MANIEESAGPSQTPTKRTKHKIEELATIIPLPPDGGWGWVIVAVCSIGNLSIDSASLSFASMQPHLAEMLNASLAQISLIVSVYNCMCYLFGPMSGALANRLGFRLTMLIGSAFGCAGIGISYFLNNFIAHICCYGIIAGTGGSMVYMTSMAAPGFWFEEKKALAAGISTCSTGLAAIIVPVVSTLIEENFSWRFVVVIPAGMYFILFLLAFLIRTAPAVYVQSDKPRMPHSKLKEDIFTPSSTLSLLGGGAHSHRKLLQISQHTGLRADELTQISLPLLQPSKRKCNWCKNVRTIERPMYRKDVFYQGSVTRIRERRSLLPGQYTLSVAKMPTIKDVREEVDCKCTLCPEAFKRGLSTLFNFAVCTNKPFIMMLFATFFFYCGVYIPFLYLRRVSLENGLEAKYANLLTPLFGIGITLSRCTVGIILLIFPRLGSLNITVASSVLASLLSFFLTINFHKIYQITMNILFGFISGFFLPLRSVILIDYVGLEKLTSAMGFIFTVQGIGSFAGVPVAEILMLYFNDTRWALYHASIVFFISTLFISPIYFFPIHWQQSYHENEGLVNQNFSIFQVHRSSTENK